MYSGWYWNIYISINQWQKVQFVLFDSERNIKHSAIIRPTMADLILRSSSNNAKFMDNAPLFLCQRTKGQSYWWKFLLFFTNQPFDIQIVCLPGMYLYWIRIYFVIESNSLCSVDNWQTTKHWICCWEAANTQFSHLHFNHWNIIFLGLMDIYNQF